MTPAQQASIVPEFSRQAGCNCDTHNTAAGKWRLRKPIDLDTGEKVIALHRQNINTQRNIVKADLKRRLSRVHIGGASYIVKEYKCARFRGPWRPDRISWRNHHHLERLGLPTCHCYAWLKAAEPGIGFLILEDLGQMTAMQYLQQATERGARRRIIEDIGQIMGQLHIRGVDHCDFTPVNFMLAGKRCDCAGALTLIDVDSVNFHRHLIPRKRRLRNIDQLFELLSTCIFRAEALRLLAKYRRIVGREALDTLTGLACINRYWQR